MEEPGCVVGDFNSILHQREGIGGNEVLDSELKGFSECLRQSSLQEFIHHGASFSWTNKTIWSRIDRALLNTLWYDTFDFTLVTYQSQSLSDHTPSTLDFYSYPKLKKTFHFYEMWAKDAMFKELVQHNIERSMPISKLQALKNFLCSLKHSLKQLNRSKYTYIYEQQARVALV